MSIGYARRFIVEAPGPTRAHTLVGEGGEVDEGRRRGTAQKKKEEKKAKKKKGRKRCFAIDSENAWNGPIKDGVWIVVKSCCSPWGSQVWLSGGGVRFVERGEGEEGRNVYFLYFIGT